MQYLSRDLGFGVIYSTGILIFFNWGRREERGRKRETGKREGMAGFKLVWKKTK